MRFTDLICISVILALYSSIFTGLFSQISRVDRELSEIRNKTESMIFISESFLNQCNGKGFSSFDEWKEVCRDMWELESIDLQHFGNEENEFYICHWNGPYGSGEVYGKNESKE